MSPVFRHGRLRLYLLKLLDEAPRHGYEIIRLLQDRFMGVYAPSPGTIYPRLARLEEEGLVTHDEADGRKVYRITDKGREELRSRLDDLAELEDSITASVRDIAREVTEDVRETVRNLREELAWAVRDVQGAPRGQQGTGQQPGAGQAQRDAEQQRLDAEAERLDAEQARIDAERERLQAERERLQAERERLDADHERPEDGAGGQEQRPGGAWAQGGGRSWGRGNEWGDWSGWARWAGRGWTGQGPSGCADPSAYRDLERLAKQFTRDLRAAASQAQAVSEDAVHDLRDILDDAISRIKEEVFTAHKPPAPASSTGESSAGEEPPTGTSPPE